MCICNTVKTFEILDVQSLFLVYGNMLREYELISYMKVIGSSSGSRQKSATFPFPVVQKFNRL